MWEGVEHRTSCILIENSTVFKLLHMFSITCGLHFNTKECSDPGELVTKSYNLTYPLITVVNLIEEILISFNSNEFLNFPFQMACSYCKFYKFGTL